MQDEHKLFLVEGRQREHTPMQGLMGFDFEHKVVLTYTGQNNQVVAKQLTEADIEALKMFWRHLHN